MQARAKNDMKPSADAVLLLEALLVLRAQRHHGAHVDLVERGEDRGGVLRLRRGARRCACGCGVIGTALLAARAGGPRRARRGAARAPRRGGRAAARPSRPARDARGASGRRSLVRRPPLPDAGDRGRVEAVLVDQVAHRRAERPDRPGRRPALADGRGRGSAPAPRPAAAGAGGAGAGVRPRRGCAAARRRVAVVDARDHVARRRTVSPSCFSDAEHAGALRRAAPWSPCRSRARAARRRARRCRRRAFTQRAIVASVTDSPRLGMRTSNMRRPALRRARRRAFTSSASSAWCTLYEPVAGLAAASRADVRERAAAEQRPQQRRDEAPRAHVRRLLLHPAAPARALRVAAEHAPRARAAGTGRAARRARCATSCRCRARGAPVEQRVVDLAAAQQHAADARRDRA